MISEVSADLKIVTVAKPKGFLETESINFPLMLPWANKEEQAIDKQTAINIFFIVSVSSLRLLRARYN